MKISVNEQAQRFYLAFEEWTPAVGHEIKVGKYRFSAIPMSGQINVSEVTSGCKVFNIPMTVESMMITATKEGTIKYCYKIGESLKRLILKAPNFDEQLKQMKNESFERLGEMPPIEKVDTDWVFEDESEVLH